MRVAEEEEPCNGRNTADRPSHRGLLAGRHRQRDHPVAVYGEVAATPASGRKGWRIVSTAPSDAPAQASWREGSGYDTKMTVIVVYANPVTEPAT